MPDEAGQQGKQLTTDDFRLYLELAKFAVDLIEKLMPKGDEILLWGYPNGPPVKAGIELQFAVDKIDDEAELFFNGKEIGRSGGTSQFQGAGTVQSGDNVLVLKVRNSGGGRWGARMKAGVPGPGARPYINWKASTDDGWFPTLQVRTRQFTWRFPGT